MLIDVNSYNLTWPLETTLLLLNIIIIIKAICNTQDPLKKAANALSGS